MYETIRFDVDAATGVATLTLQRPERLNAFTVTMHAEVRRALDDVGADPAIRCLVVTGAGRAFCAGQDLADRVVDPAGGTTGVDLGRTLETLYNPLVTAVRQLPMPVIAAVNGVAAGAGANIALACDLVYAARSASFIQSFSKLGLVPDSGGTWSLPHRIGTARALGLALLGEKLGAQQALAWGLIWQVVDDELLLPTVQTVAAALARGPTRGLAATKRAIYAAATSSFDESLLRERDLQRELGASDDYREGVAAFFAKRPARFVGR